MAALDPGWAAVVVAGFGFAGTITTVIITNRQSRGRQEVMQSSVDHNTKITSDTKRITSDTNEQVAILNGSTAGDLLSATEDRRVAEIPFAQRTVQEQEHLDQAPPEEPAQGADPRRKPRRKPKPD